MDYTSALGDDSILDQFDGTPAAAELDALPAGVYEAVTASGELTTARTSGAPMYRVRFAVTAPAEHAGRTLIRCFVFTPRALPYVRRDLLRFGLASKADLLKPFPGETAFKCKLTVAVQTLADGRRVNDVKHVQVVGTAPVAPAVPDGFGYADDAKGGTGEPF